MPIYDSRVYAVAFISLKDTLTILWLHRCSKRMYETKCVVDNFLMLVTVMGHAHTQKIYPSYAFLGISRNIAHFKEPPVSYGPYDRMGQSNM